MRQLVLWMAMLLCGCGYNSSRLAGTWEMVQPRYDPPARKVLTDSHFAFGHQDGGRPLAGGGRYVLDGETYVEIVDYHFLPELVGQELRFEVRLEGNTWRHRGVLPLRSGPRRIDEVWRRVGVDEVPRAPRRWTPHR